jgi:hypothetical protein
MKKATSKPDKKVVSKVDPNLLKEVEAFLHERIADGGATTDHLKSLLHKINPAEPVAPSALLLEGKETITVS